MNKTVSLLLLSVALLSCTVVGDNTDKLSCNNSEINCYRFSYVSLDEFRKTVGSHAMKWSLSNPLKALAEMAKDSPININSASEANVLITSQPELIFLVGQFIETHNKPREWLFVSEQAFIRSWNNLSR